MTTTRSTKKTPDTATTTTRRSTRATAATKAAKAVPARRPRRAAALLAAPTDPPATAMTAPVASARAVAEDLMVQADLAAMDGRDQWAKLTADIEARRQRLDRAVRELVDGGMAASRTLVTAAREALDELRTAMEAAARTLR